MERAKSFVNVHKTSFQSERVIPNDDLVLNQARRQKSFVGPSAKKIAQLKIPGENKVNSIQRAASMGNLDKKEEIVRVRSLVEVDDYDGKRHDRPNFWSTVLQSRQNAVFSKNI